MINPRQLNIWSNKFSDRARGYKHYRAGFDMPGFSRLTRRHFKTASEALEYGQRVKVRWCRLYDAAVLAIVSAQEPTA